MRLKSANCKNCYKCVRFCPVKAISLTEDQATIEEERCIFCGKCYMVCPQDARDLLGDLDRVKMMIKQGEKVYVSISSAFSTYFSSTSLKAMGAVLKKLGVTRVEETAIGGNRVIEEYTKIIKSHEYKNIISTLCPSTNFMIQKYFPNLVKWMCPVDTPLEAHAKMMRAAYGDDIKIVGIGPCIAEHKLSDMTQSGELIDAFLTYEELEMWMKESGVEIAEEDPETQPVSDYRGRYLDEDGGLFRALPADIKYGYKLWEVNGASRTKEMLAGMSSEDTDNYCVVISACANNCLGGPIVRLAHRDTFESKDRWLSSIKEGVEKSGRNLSEEAVVDIHKEFKPLPIKQATPTKEEIDFFLSLIGRKHKEDHLDCGGCGYNTCTAKAVAVFRGMADPFMCIPQSRDKAEAKSNLLFDNAPNGVAVMDKEFNIIEINPVAEGILGISTVEAAGHNMTEFIDSDFLEKSSLKEVKATHERMFVQSLEKLIDLTFFKITGHDISMLLMTDRTEIAAKAEEEHKIRKETIDVTQKVVEKQMRIAQEIASLLGETTAETKLALNKLKNSLTMEDENRWD
jgi:iron only hydrogenase large subunit-like protein/uncharacterized Fe-S cluster-containing protein